MEERRSGYGRFNRPEREGGFSGNRGYGGRDGGHGGGGFGGNRSEGFGGRGGGGGGFGGRGGDRGRGRGRGRGKKLPILMGEPSPSLAKINRMNTEQLQAKIVSLSKEQELVAARIMRLRAVHPVPEEKIDQLKTLLHRLEALKKIAEERLDGKNERSARREGGYSRG